MPEVSYREASKIKVLEAPRLAPGTCCICGTSRTDDRQYIDMNWDIEWYGVVYFCTFCFIQAVNTIGCLTREQSEALEEENNRLRQMVIDFRAKEAVIDDTANKLRDSGILDFVTNRDSSDADSSISPGAQTITEFYDGIQQGSAQTGKSTEQSNSKQGSDDVSSSDTINDFGEF